MKQSILVIDDDLDLLMLLERILVEEGYYVETAANINEAEEILSEIAPQLVLLDINVNGEDGRKLCWEIKNSGFYRPMKVIIMSAYDINTGRAVLFGADDLLPKPFELEFLLYKIRYYLQQPTGVQVSVKE
jgi:DNA-binding response OmpR family regulator